MLSSTQTLTIPQLHRQIAFVMGSRPDEVKIFLPNEAIADVAFRGAAVAGVVAADNEQGHQVHGSVRGLFVNAPDFGCEICLQFHSTLLLGVEDFLESLGLDVPEGHVAKVDGYQRCASQAGKFVFAPTAVATIWVEPEGLDESSTSNDFWPDDGEEPGDGVSRDSAERDPATDNVRRGSNTQRSSCRHASSDQLHRSRSPRRENDLVDKGTCEPVKFFCIADDDSGHGSDGERSNDTALPVAPLPTLPVAPLPICSDLVMWKSDSDGEVVADYHKVDTSDNSVLRIRP